MDEANVKYNEICNYIIDNVFGSNVTLSNQCKDELSAYINEHMSEENFDMVCATKKARELALDIYDNNKDGMNGSGEVELILDELNDFEETSKEGFEQSINDFLSNISAINRKIFVRRYFYMSSMSDIAKEYDMTESSVRTSLVRTRGELMAFLNPWG